MCTVCSDKAAASAEGGSTNPERAEIFETYSRTHVKKKSNQDSFAMVGHARKYSLLRMENAREVDTQLFIRAAASLLPRAQT
jgi:ribosomal protein S10